jgi:hypothetical protein
VAAEALKMTSSDMKKAEVDIIPEPRRSALTERLLL